MICDSFLGNLLTVVVGLATAIFVFYKYRYTYWKRRNLPYLEPKIPFGNTVSPFKRTESSGVTLKRNYDEMKARGWRHGGLFSVFQPIYVLTDLDYVRNILTKDFQYFVDRPVYVNEKDDPLSAHLFNMSGQKWRNMRMKLTPTFTSGKMKMMYHILFECVPSFLKKIESDRINKEPIDIKEALGCFTTDIIGCCAFGLDCNSFEQENSPFRHYGRKFFNFDKVRIMIAIVCMSFPNLSRLLGLSMTPKDITEFFIKVVKDTVNHREKNNVVRKDFMQLLIDLKNNKLEDINADGTTLTIEELAAQSFVFFVAGFETSSTTMTFAMYELARRPEMQNKLREEINTVLGKHDGKITYDAVQELKYLDRIINETLRMYPPVPLLFRTCVKDYKVPDCDIVIEKGVRVMISTLGIHHDKDHYPDPEKFDPDRFTEENKSKRHNYAHLPFGEGPRNCIGMRFGLMQSKVGLALLIKNYKFSVNKKTIQPLKMKVHSFIPAAEGEIWLDAEKI